MEITLLTFLAGKLLGLESGADKPAGEFDIDEALSFEGESGPYIQYAVVRANNIFQKVQQRDGLGHPAQDKGVRPL